MCACVCGQASIQFKLQYESLADFSLSQKTTILQILKGHTLSFDIFLLDVPVFNKHYPCSFDSITCYVYSKVIYYQHLRQIQPPEVFTVYQ